MLSSFFKKMNKKIVLIGANNRGNYVQGTFSRENLGLGYLEAYLLEAGFEVMVIDARLENSTTNCVAAEISKFKPFLVGFSIIAKDGVNWCEDVCQILKNNKEKIPHICIGSYFPTLQPERALKSMPSADSLIMGEGEVTFKKLAELLFFEKKWQHLLGLAYRSNSGIIINKRRRLIKNLDKLPFPCHYAAKYGLREFAIEGSRGCYCACSFCSISPFANAKTSKEMWRFRSVIRIVDEIEILINKFPNINTFRFIDPDFVGSIKHLDRLHDFIYEIKKRNLKINFIIDTRTEVVNGITENIWKELYDVGLKEVYIGVENSSPNIKKMMLKRSTIENDIAAISLLENIGIRARFGFMMITPWSTSEDIENNANFLSRFGFSRLDKYFQEMYLVPGTSAVKLIDGKIKTWFDYNGSGEYYTYELPSPIKELRQICRFLVENRNDFLSEIQKLHESIRFLEISGENVDDLKNSVNDFNYNIFISIFKLSKVFSHLKKLSILEDGLDSLINDYKERLNIIEKKLFCIKINFKTYGPVKYRKSALS